MRNNITGRLVDFFNHHALAGEVISLLEAPDERERLGAREFARQHYDLQTVCLPRQLAWVKTLENSYPHKEAA